MAAITKLKVTRYGNDGTHPIKEECVFIQSGDGGTDVDDPRAITIAGESGKWLLEAVANPLHDLDFGTLMAGSAPVDPASGSAKAGYTITDQATYDTAIVAGEAATATAKAARKTALDQKKSDMETALLRVGFTAQEVEYFK